MNISSAIRSAISTAYAFVFLAPSLLAAAYMLLVGHGNFSERLVGAFAVGVAVPTVAVLGYAVCLAIVSKVLRIDNDEKLFSGLQMHHVVAGLLLVVSIWIWWQSDKRSAVSEIARCVAEAKRSGDLPIDSLTVISCYDERGSDVESDQ